MSNRLRVRPPRPRRRGQLIPVVGVVLVIFGFMAFSYMFHSQTVTSVTGVAIYGLKAHQLALAAQDEASLVLKEKFDDGGSPGPWKQELIDLLKDQNDGPAVQIEKDLTGELPEALSVIASQEGELMEAKLKLHGFHRLNYGSTDAYDSPDTIYHNDDVFDDRNDGEDPNKVNPPKDWVGFATVQIRVKVRGVERQVQMSHDVKLVDVSPMAREFTFFNWLPLTQEQAAQGLGMKSLNEGGRMIVWPNDVGRVMMRGPYRVITEGNPKGDGGTERRGRMRQNMSYPDPDDKWIGWSAVPRLRALLYNSLAWPWGKNIRPKKDGLEVLAYLRIPTISFVTLIANDHVIDCNTQKFFTATTEVGNQKFSIWGDPGNGNVALPPNADGNPTNNGFSMFRGARVKYDKRGNASAQGIHDSGAALGGGDNGDSIEPEGLGLFGLYKMASFRNVASLKICLYYIPPLEWLVDGFMIRCIPAPGCPGIGLATLTSPGNLDANNVLSVSGGDYQEAPYGLRYMEKESIPIWASLLSAAIEFVASYAAGSTLGGNVGSGFVGGTAFGTWGNITMSGIGSFMNFAGSQLATNMLVQSSMSAVSPTLGGQLPTSADLANVAPQGIFPPKFRPHLRGATRIHPNLAEALNEDGSLLTLDGVVAVEAMPQDQAATFKYKGRGVLYTATDGNDANKNPFLGDIGPENPDEDWMTFSFHAMRSPPPPDGGDCQVKLNSNQLEMTLYSQEGVTMESQSALFGNLVTMTPNKHRIPDGAQFDVFYNWKRLAPAAHQGPDPAQWNDGTWKRVSVSPKVSGYYDRYR